MSLVVTAEDFAAPDTGRSSSSCVPCGSSSCVPCSSSSCVPCSSSSCVPCSSSSCVPCSSSSCVPCSSSSCVPCSVLFARNHFLCWFATSYVSQLPLAYLHIRRCCPRTATSPPARQLSWWQPSLMGRTRWTQQSRWGTGQGHSNNVCIWRSGNQDCCLKA
jgi:hypothetical protein